MEETIENIIIKQFAPILIPLPFTDEYKKEICIIDSCVCKNVTFDGKYSYTGNDSIEEIKLFILDSIFKVQESMQIYNTIFVDAVGPVKVYNMQITLVNGNKKFNYKYSTLEKLVFLKHLKEYSLIASNNGFNDITTSINAIIQTANSDEIYKFKSKRKSLI